MPATFKDILQNPESKSGNQEKQHIIRRNVSHTQCDRSMESCRHAIPKNIYYKYFGYIKIEKNQE
jgi:hypothetical protein